MNESQTVSSSETETQKALKANRRKRLAKRMAAYSVAAAATVATGQTASAAINWSGIVGTSVVNGSVDIDVDGDGDYDFRLTHDSTSYAPDGLLTIEGLDPGNMVAGGLGANALFYPTNFQGPHPSDSVGNSSFYINDLTTFTSVNAPTAGILAVNPISVSSVILGPANFEDPLNPGGSRGYIAFAVNDAGDTGTNDSSFGWIRMQVGPDPGNRGLINEYAATVGGGLIKVGQNVPEPSALGLLAAGGVGLLSWRRKKKLRQ